MPKEEEKKVELPKSETELQYDKELQEKSDLMAIMATPGGKLILDGATNEAELAIYALIATYRNTTVNELLSQITRLEANLKIIATLTQAKDQAEVIKGLIAGLKE